MSFVPDLRTVLRERHFGRLYATRLTSQAADGVFQVTLASYVFFSPQQQTTAGKAAATFATLLVPYSVVSPFAGVFIDRWRRQRILVLGNLIRTAMVLFVALLVLSGTKGPLFYASTLAVLSVNRFFLASLSASLPHVVRPALLVMGNSVSATSGTLVTVLGAGIGYGARVLAGSDNPGAATVLLTAAALYASSSWVASTMDRDLLGPDEDEARPETRRELAHVVRGVADGARHIWSHRRAGRALLAITAHRFFYGISTIATILLYRNYFNGGNDVNAGVGGLALVILVSGVGYFVAAVITPLAAARWGEERWVVALFVAAAVVEVAFGVPYTQPSFLCAAFFLGVVAQGVKIMVDTIVQESVDDAFRGRVFSFYDLLFNVSFVSAAAFAALTLPSNGKSYAVLGVIAAGYALTAVAYAWRSRPVFSQRGPADRYPAPAPR